MTLRINVVHDDNKFRVTRRSSGGKGVPPSIFIEAKFWMAKGDSFRARKLHITIDELFDLAEALDDICDMIEDQEDEKSRKKQGLI